MKTLKQELQMENKLQLKTVPFALVGLFAIAAAGCGGGESEPGAEISEHSCSMPCLAAPPLMNAAQISSATGGTITLEFDIRGDISNVANITVLLSSEDFFSPDTAGDAVVVYPTDTHQKIIVPVDSGTPTGVYFPWISMSMVAPENSGNQYYIDPTKSTSKYTYVEVSGGSATNPVLTPYAIPKLTVLP